ncbi:hypothetical protein [Trinickia fusca]|uniref:Uncharacterized protein n=1 Tax=Trinickia fusca TaxID=2419777 RepID=A0A494XB41_9BURK|nr:hypothetical protein [Trinickia fusca]RKP46861.1 hypothetical protein D7S89_16010 [Trinickia fusca]
MTFRKPLTRHNAAPLAEFLYYANGLPMRYLCRTLQRHERTIKSWMSGQAVIPPWAVAVLRLRLLERDLIRDQMGLTAIEQEQRLKKPQPVIRPRPAANEEQFAIQLRLDIA